MKDDSLDRWLRRSDKHLAPDENTIVCNQWFIRKGIIHGTTVDGAVMTSTLVSHKRVMEDGSYFCKVQSGATYHLLITD